MFYLLLGQALTETGNGNLMSLSDRYTKSVIIVMEVSDLIQVLRIIRYGWNKSVHASSGYDNKIKAAEQKTTVLKLYIIFAE